MTQPVTSPPDPVGAALLEIGAHWCAEGRRLGAEFAQAFAESAADLRIETVAGGGLPDGGTAWQPDGSTASRRGGGPGGGPRGGTVSGRGGVLLDRRCGVGLLLRYRDTWWYGSAPLAQPEQLAQRLATVPGFGQPRQPPPWPGPDLELDRPDAPGPGWDETLARAAATGYTGPNSPSPGGAVQGRAVQDWAVGSGGPGSSQVIFMQDYFQQRRAVVDSAGARASWQVRGGRQRAIATVVAGGAAARSFTRRSSPDWQLAGGAGELASADDLARDAVARARGLLAARSMGLRSTPVVFAPAVGAALLHELIGHALEADNFAMNSPYTTALVDAVLCDAALDLVDDPAMAGGIGSRAADDDGQPCAPVTMVARGTVVGQLDCVRSTYPAAGPRGASGRRQDYRQAALPRASNTVVLPGPDSAAALAEPPPGGLLYVAALSSGEISLNRGEFSFAAGESYYLTPGGEPQPVKDAHFFGDARGALRRLTGIAADLRGDNVTCGKHGQSVLIGLYSPTMRFDELSWWS